MVNPIVPDEATSDNGLVVWRIGSAAAGGFPPRSGTASTAAHDQRLYLHQDQQQQHHHQHVDAEEGLLT